MNLTYLEKQLRSLLPYPYPSRVAVGVSGGADSLCLTWLLTQWARTNNVALTALTVDHRLRPQSAVEADEVAQQMKAWGVPHSILPLPHPPQKRVQEQARWLRYQEVALFCHHHEISTLFLGHHQDDQFETWGMRLIAGSGLYGLGGMVPVSTFLGLHLIRPFLTWPASFLRKILEVEEISWIDDPFNRSPLFQRARLRQAFQELSLNERSFWNQEIARLNQQRQSLQRQCRLFLETHCQVGEEGYVQINLPSFLSLSSDLQQQVLSHLLTAVGGARPHPLSRVSLQRVLTALQSTLLKGATSGGCSISIKNNQIWVVREWKRIQPLLLREVPEALFWDHRFYLRFSPSVQQRHNLILHPQGWGGKRQPHLPAAVAASLPTLSSQDGGEASLIHAPFTSVRWLGAVSFNSFKHN